jgi:DNA-binding XRE family transcriptional regulator
MMPKETDAIRDAKIEAIRTGVDARRTLTAIASDLGIHPSTASALAKRAGIQVRGRPPQVVHAVPSSMKPDDLVLWRKSHGFTQDAASKLLGISKRTLVHAENGNTRCRMRVPKVPRLIELATKGLDAELRLVKFRMAERALRAAVPDG